MREIQGAGDPMRLKIAVQKSGRLTDSSLDLLSRCGLKYSRGKDQLMCYGENMPLDVLFVRDDDIPDLVQEDVCDLGLVGLNVVEEKRLAFQAREEACPQRLAAAMTEIGARLGNQGISGSRHHSQQIFGAEPRSLQHIHRAKQPVMAERRDLSHRMDSAAQSYEIGGDGIAARTLRPVGKQAVHAGPLERGFERQQGRRARFEKSPVIIAGRQVERRDRIDPAKHCFDRREMCDGGGILFGKPVLAIGEPGGRVQE